jgi:lipopolysaccharide/colanic/teichoic acid biosynthesis glycosyltransferase
MDNDIYSKPAKKISALKIIFDFIAALCALLVLWPLLLIISILIRTDSQGPIFYRGVRTGLHGKPFRIYKFRTMVIDAEKIGGPSTALNDPRLTRIGKFLRNYKLDELPQLINILIGDMSFVGPRPQVEYYTRSYSDEEKIILSVRPGLTDYASIHFIDLDAILGDENVDEKYSREIEPLKNRLRIKYASRNNLFIDMKIILMTLTQMFKIKSKWNIRN